MRSKKTRKIIAFLLALLLILPGNIGGLSENAKVKASENVIEFGNFFCTKGPDILATRVYDSSTNEPLDVVDVDSNFGISCIVDSEGEGCMSFLLYLVPYGTAHTLQDFLACESKQELGHTGSISYGHVNSNVWSEDYYKYELDMQQAMFEHSTGKYPEALASGLYTPVCFYLLNDALDEHAQAKVMFSNRPIRLNNKSDGGYINDEHYGYEESTMYVNLQVNAYVDGILADKNDLSIKVYDDFMNCYGTAPCMVPIGSDIKLEIKPVNDAYELIYDYPFQENGLYLEKVPDNGKLDIFIGKTEQNTWISGNVKLADINGENAENAWGATVTILQRINGKTQSFVTKTNTNGDYSQKVYSNIPATVIVAEKYFTSYEKELGTELMASDRVEVNAILTKKSENAAAFDKGVIRIPVDSHSIGFTSAVAMVFREDGLTADDSSLLISSESLTDGLDTENVFTFELPAGEYKIIIFDDSYGSSSYIYTYEQVANVLKKEEYLELNQTVNINEIITLETQEVPVNISGNVTPISEGSYINAPDSFTDKNSLLSINGHIECEAGELSITRLYLTAADRKSSNNYLISAAKLCADTLVVGGKVKPASYLDSAYNSITEEIALNEPLNGTTDFSIKIKPAGLSDIELHIYADVTIDGVDYNYLEVGNALIKGLPLTLESNSHTASGKILVSGRADSNGTVYIYDNGVEVGKTTTDKYLCYETYIRLNEQPEDAKSIHVLTAVMGDKSSAPQTVIYDAKSSVLRGIYMLESGNVQPKTYVWTPRSVFSFEAVYENAADLDEITIFVLCSDGSILDFTAKKKENTGLSELLKAETTRYVTEDYAFGAEQLVPVKAWAVTEKPEIGEKTESYNGIIGEANYRPKDDLDALQWNIAEKLSTEYPTEANLSEDYAGFGFITYQTEVAEIEALAKKGAYHTQITDDAGRLKYDCYMLIKNGTTTYAYIDYADAENPGQAYVLMSSIITEKGFSPDIRKVYSTIDKEVRSFEADENADEDFQRTIGSQVAIAEQEGSMWGQAFINSAGPYAYDFLVDSLNESLAEGAGDTMKPDKIKGVPLGDLLSIKSVAEAGIQFYTVQNETSTSRSELMFYKSLMTGYAQKDAVDSASYKRVNASLDNAIHSMDRASSIYRDRFLSVAESAVVCKVAELGGAYAKAVGTVGGMVGGLMTDDMAVNGEVVLNEARGEYLESQFYIMKATGLSQADLKELYNDYKQGLTFHTIRKKMAKKAEENKEGSEYKAVIDPSGYVYEAVASNRIEGATVTIYSEGMLEFDAESFNQRNPLSTAADGRYAWDVPEGLWFVKAVKEGYLPGDSQNDPAATVTKDGVNYLPVLPIQLDVNIPLMSEGKPNAQVIFTVDGAFLVFDKYVMLDTVNNSNLKITDSKGNVIKAEAIDEEVSPAQTPVCGGKALARSFKLTSDVKLDSQSSFTVNISKDLLAYNGKGRALEIKVNGGAEDEKNKPDATPVPEKPSNDDTEKNNDTDKQGLPVWIIVVLGLIIFAGAGVGAFLFIKKKK